MSQYPDEVLKLIIRIEQLARTADKKLLKQLKRMQKELIMGFVDGPTKINTYKQLFRLRKKLKKIAAAVHKDIEDTIGEYSETAAQAAIEVEKTGMATLGVDASEVYKDYVSEEVVSRAMERNLPGLPEGKQISVGDMLNRMSNNSIEAVTNVANVALAEGLSIDQASRKIRSVLDLTRSQSKSVMRTSMLASLNQARDEVAEKLDVEKEIWLATLDAKTCEYCAGRDGLCKEQGKLPKPPAHPNCRCTLLYLPPTISCKQIKEDMERPYRDEDGRSTRHTPYQDYGEWILKQPKEFQEEILGKERSALLRAGKIKFPQMYLRNGSRKTLKQIRKQYNLPDKQKPAPIPKAVSGVKPSQDQLKNIAQKVTNTEQYKKAKEQHLAATKNLNDKRRDFLKVNKKSTPYSIKKNAYDQMAASKDLEKLRLAELKAVEAKAIPAFNAALRPPKGGSIPWTVGKGKTKLNKDKAVFNNGFDEVSNMFHPDILDQLPPITLNFRKGQRAFYSKNRIFLGNESFRTMAHEYGHHVEGNIPGLKERAVAFRTKRAAGEPLTKIYKSERGYEDKFFSHYCGKVYAHGTTEIISMGVEKIYFDPITFFEDDPDYFNFILDIIWGE